MRTMLLATTATAFLAAGFCSTPASAITLPAAGGLKAAAGAVDMTDKVVCFGWRGCYDGPGYGYRPYGYRPYYGGSYGYRPYYSGGYGYRPYYGGGYGYRPSYSGYGYRPYYGGYGYGYSRPHYYYVGPNVYSF
jgi:hypothetical protein